MWSFLIGPGIPEASAQSGCGINVSYFKELPTERIIDGITYKRVQVVVNKPNQGINAKFYFLIDDAVRDTSTKYYPYGYNTEEFLVPVDAKVITFYDFSISTCSVGVTPNFTPNNCTFKVDTHIDLSEDCYHRTITYSVENSTVIDSVAWIRNGGRIPVHDQMSWSNIPLGSYEIFFYDTAGCEATSILEPCLRTDAGSDHSLQYCIGENDTVNLYDIVDSGVDSGGFYTEEFSPLDSEGTTELVFDTEGDIKFYYITSAKLGIPDTSLITIDVRDCSVCAYELIAAQRHCSAPEMVEVSIGGGSPQDSTFLVTLPDGTTSTQEFFKPFQFNFPDYQDSLQLHLHMDTPTGTCDSTLMIDPIPNPMVLITANEVELSGDSVGIRVSAGQGMEPYQIDIFVGAQQKFVQLQESVPVQLDFLKSQDTAFIMAEDDQGCIGTDTLVLTPDCIVPEVTFLPATCGQSNGQITVDSSTLPPGRQITWLDTNIMNVWQLTDLAPGTYLYSVSYDDCQVEGNVTIEAPAPIEPMVLRANDCLLDGEVEIYIQDSSQVTLWSYDENVLPYFSGYFPANKDHLFFIETIDGCVDSIVVREDEPYWLEQIGYQQPNSLLTVLGVDLNQLTDFGWQMGDSILCHPCGDYESETMVTTGSYTFFAEQGPGCRRDTTIRVNQSEHQFLMPNVITPGKNRNNLIQIFDPLDQMASIMEFQVYDRYGNILYEKSDFYPDDDASLNWPNGMTTGLPDIIICVARIKCKEGDEVFMSQDVLILR